MNGAITEGGGEGTEEEEEWNRHPPQVRSTPTFQPWLRLWTVTWILDSKKVSKSTYKSPLVARVNRRRWGIGPSERCFLEILPNASGKKVKCVKSVIPHYVKT